MPKSTKQKSGTSKAVVTNRRRSGRQVSKPARLQSELDIEHSDQLNQSDNNKENSLSVNDGSNNEIRDVDLSLPSTSQSNSQPSRSEFDTLQKSFIEMKNLILQMSHKNSSNSTDTEISQDKTNNSVVNGNNPRVDQVDLSNTNDNLTNVNSANIDMSEVGNQVEDAVNQHIDMMMPKDNIIPTMSTRTSEYCDIGRPIDLKVPDKVKRQIWNHEYVDLYSLIDPNAEIPDYLRLVNDGGLRWAPQKESKTYLNFGSMV